MSDFQEILMNVPDWQYYYTVDESITTPFRPSFRNLVRLFVRLLVLPINYMNHINC